MQYLHMFFFVSTYCDFYFVVCWLFWVLGLFFFVFVFIFCRLTFVCDFIFLRVNVFWMFLFISVFLLFVLCHLVPNFLMCLFVNQAIKWITFCLVFFVCLSSCFAWVYLFQILVSFFFVGFVFSCVFFPFEFLLVLVILSCLSWHEKLKVWMSFLTDLEEFVQILKTMLFGGNNVSSMI